jgi:hypothetical protein
MLALGTAECRVPARGLLYEVELLVGVAAQWMPVMEQQNNVFQLKGYSTRWEDLGGRLLASICKDDSCNDGDGGYCWCCCLSWWFLCESA